MDDKKHIIISAPRHRLQELFHALVSLNGYNKIVGENVVPVPYKFDSKTRIKIADNLLILRKTDLELRQLQEDLTHSITGGVVRFDPNEHPDWDADFRRAFKPFREAVIEVGGLKPLTADEILNEDRNPVQPAALSVIIEFLSPKGE